MTATDWQLLRNEVAETYQVVELPWHGWVAIYVGYFALLVLAFVVVFGIVPFLRRTVKGWLTKPEPPDVPDFVVCTCPSRLTTSGPNPKCPYHGYNAYVTGNHNHTATLSVSEMKDTNS